MPIAAIISAVLPLVPLIRGLIQGSENTLGSGKGPEKKELAVAGIRPFFKILQDSGKLPAGVDLAVVEDVIEMIFGEMQAFNELREKKSTAEAPPFKAGVSWPAIFQGTINFKEIK